MRPVSLLIQAFGSFAEREQVRFDTLAELGLFVVTGPTGSGKTTIFDAMAFALYGKVAGDRPADVRSHHAPVGLGTEVELVFEVDRRRYRVWRSPQQERAKQRGTGTRTVAPAAELYEWTGEGWQGLVSQPTKVTQRCVELIGLDLDQFQRVVLLPQGKFAEFLLSDTAKRQDLLRQLFGSSLYLAATEWYQDEAKRLQAEVGQIDQLVGHHRTNALEDVRDVQRQLPPEPDGTLFFEGAVELADDATVDAIDAALDACIPQLAARQGDHAALADRASAAARAATVALDAASRFDRFVDLTVQQQALVAQQCEVRHAATRVERARAAAPVLAAEERVTAATAGYDEATHAERCRRTAVSAGFAELGLVEPGQPSVAGTALAVHAARLAAQLEQLEAMLVANRVRDERRAQLDRAVADMACADIQVQAALDARAAAEQARDTLAARAGRLEATLAAESAVRATVVRRRRLDALGDALLAANVAVREASDREQHLVRQFALGVAPRLAQSLRDGEPCSVCGSLQHPAPARHDDQVEVVDVHQLTGARDAVDAARDAASAVVAEISVLRTELGGVADVEPAHVEAELVVVAAAAADAQEAAARLEQQAGEATRRARAHDAAAAAREGARIDLAGATARFEAADVASTEAAAPLAGVAEEDVRRGVARTSRLELEVSAWADAVAARSRAQGELERSTAHRAACLGASGFVDIAAAAEVGLAEPEVEALDRRVLAWQHEVTSVEERLAGLVEQGVPADRPDVDTLTERARLLGVEATAMGAVLARIEQRCLDARSSIDRARSVASGSADLRREHEVARTVMLTCSGQLGQRIMLETWVLAAELDRVTDAATVHLHRMSAGRYALRRGDTAVAGNRRTGLDLLVFDAHTGRERVPATLSGGERFQASLALALGLADVVSQGGTGSGRVFEALFVDEGFGSLDPDALDDAIEALQHLHATGRMVGVITHVEAMKQQLRTGIEVRPRHDGRGASIVQAADLTSTRA